MYLGTFTSLMKLEGERKSAGHTQPGIKDEAVDTILFAS